MRKLISYGIVPLLLLILLQSVQAQQTALKGKVLAADDQLPLPGTSVTVKGTTKGTLTDVNGNFIINAAGNDILVISMLGFKTVEIPVAGKQEITVSLESSLAVLNEIIVTGYQTERKKDLTGSVAVVDVGEIKKQAVANPVKALQGQVPGVSITTNGSPSAPATVRIRGIGTLNNNDPLYIIDGLPTKAGMHELNSADIESIQVLKDASSASIYGSRAANGVIIITTKKAKKGATDINFNAYNSFSNYLSKTKMLNTEQYAGVLWQALVNKEIDPNTNNMQFRYDWSADPVTGRTTLHKIYVPEYLDAAHTMRTANTKWFDEISQTGHIQNYDLQISKGTENSNQLLSLGYFDNKGIIRETGFKRYSVRVNSDYNLFENKLTIGQNLSITNTSEVENAPMFDALVAVPMIPVRTVDGKGWGGPVAGMNDRQNPVRLIHDNKQNGYNYTRIFGNLYGNLQLAKGLTYRTNFGVDYGSYTTRHWQKKYQTGYLESDINSVSNSQSHSYKTTFTNTLNYTLNKVGHKLDVLAGTELVTDNFSTFFASRRGYILEEDDYMYLDAGTGIKDNGGSGARNVLLSYFAKGNYSYLDKYLISGTLRYDGSSRFGKNNRFGLFPAVSAGWRISEESFLKEKRNVLDDLKLRLGWGKTGNQEIDNQAVYNIYVTDYNSTGYDIGGNKSGILSSGFYLTQNANPDLRWETTTMTNIGLDFSFFREKLFGSIDVYDKNTSDILLLPPYIGVLGEGGNMWVNGASMSNKGLELVLGSRNKIGEDWTLNLTGNIDFVRNKVTKLPSEVINAYGGDGRGQNILGRTFGSYFGYIADGLFRTQEEIDNHANQPAKALGRIKYRDLNNDGVIDDYDRTWIGSPIPDFSYGFNASITYKQFDFSVFLQGLGNVDVYNNFKMHTDFWSATESASNKGARLLNAWSPQNPNTDIPAISLTDDNWEARMSTYFIENGSYLKIRNAQIGYTFKKSFLDKVKLRTCRIYVGGDNLGLLYKSKSFSGIDPEVNGPDANVPYLGYPNPFVVTAGLNIKL